MLVDVYRGGQIMEKSKEVLFSGEGGLVICKGCLEIPGMQGCPDWNTFVELVQASNLKDKDAIINNINNSSNRERTIKEMCAIYPQLEKDILPQLRRAEVYVNEPYKEVVTRNIKVKVEKN